MISLSLFIFTSNGLAQEDSSEFLEQTFLQVIKNGNDIEHIEYLLQSGVDINTTDEFGRTAARLAASYGHIDILRFLRQKGASLNQEGHRYLCLNYMLDIRTSEQALHHTEDVVEIDLFSDRELWGMDGSIVKEETIGLELLFSLREYDDPTPLVQFIADIYDRSDRIAPSSSAFSYSLSPTILRLIEGLIEEGYRQIAEIRDALEEPPFMLSVVENVHHDRMLIPLGQHNGIQQGDVFYIYPRAENNSSPYSNCYSTGDFFGPPLTKAKVIEINENKSVIEMERDEYNAMVENERRRVQVGDTVILWRAGYNDTPELMLNVGNIPHIIIKYRDNERVMRRNITPYIMQALVQKAPDFNIRFIP